MKALTVRYKVILYNGRSFSNDDCIYMNMSDYLMNICHGYDSVLHLLDDIAKGKTYLFSEDGTIPELHDMSDAGSVGKGTKDKDDFDL